VIIPTKDRPEFINTMVQNLIVQRGNFDLFIADMSTNPNLLKDNWFLNKALLRLQHTGHSWTVVRVEGHNQLFGYQAGLEFAKGHGYEYSVASDDDIIFDLEWVRDAMMDMAHPERACVAGMTLLPWMSDEEQNCPDWYLESPEYKGKLDEDCRYYHCTLIPPEPPTDKEGRYTQPRIQEFEQLFGPFMFRVDEFVKVGGFPLFLSPLGFRGEMFPMVASFFDGMKLVRDPDLRCWHYSASHGGLKLIQGEERERGLKEDTALWEEFIRRRQPIVVDPRL